MFETGGSSQGSCDSENEVHHGIITARDRSNTHGVEDKLKNRSLSFNSVSIGYPVWGMRTSSKSKPVSSGLSSAVGRSIVKSESEAESDDLKRKSVKFFDG